MVINLPWYVDGTKWAARTIWGLITIAKCPKPWTFGGVLGQVEMGYGIYLKGKRVGWTKTASDAAHFAAGHISRLARGNKA
jgi:hypothetical protein